MLLFLGILYVWSVFVNPVSIVYEWDPAGVKLTASFMLCFFVVGILTGGKLLPKAGAEKVVLAGGLMLAAGMFATAFLTPAAAPLMSDKMGRESAALTIVLATAICALLLCFAQGILFMASIAVIAFCYGGYSGVYPVLTADYFGIKNVGVMVGFAISALSFPILIALISDATVKFIVLAALGAVGTLMILLLILSKRKKGESSFS